MNLVKEECTEKWLFEKLISEKQENGRCEAVLSYRLKSNEHVIL